MENAQSIATGRREASEGPIAGTIEHTPSELAGAIAAWRQAMEAEGRKPKSIDKFAGLVRMAMREQGWRTLADLKGAPEWMESKRRAAVKPWKGSTFNQALTIFRGFGAFIARRYQADGSIVEGTRRSRTFDSGAGSRAAKTDEARAMIQHAHHRRIADGKALSARDVYYLAIFSTGGRYSEPAAWQWRRHIFLDDPIPHIRFTRDVNKNGRDEEVPMTRELAAVLRAHREWVAKMPEAYIDRLCPHSGRRIKAYCDPEHPEAYVFPRIPPPHVWRSDRARLEIPALDRKGGTFSWHSARDWFVTTLLDAGVAGPIVRRLTRHAPDPHEGYYNGSIDKLFVHVEKLPRLWPERLEIPASAKGYSVTDGCGQHENEIIFPKVAGLPAADGRNMEGRDRDSAPPNPGSPVQEFPSPIATRREGKLRESACPRKGASPRTSRSTRFSGPGMPNSEPEKLLDPSIAEVLAIARQALKLAALALAKGVGDGHWDEGQGRNGRGEGRGQGRRQA